MATIKLNGVDQPLSPITGTDLNDKLTVDGESLDSILATLGKGKDLVEITNGSTDSPAFSQVDSNITVNGGDGDDTFQAIDGLVTLTGKLNGVAGNDDIHITSAKGATIQGGLNADTVTAGTVADLNVAGSNANAVISDSSILGGNGADTVSTRNSAEITDSTVVGGGGHDTMTIDGSLDGTSEIVQTTDGSGNTVITAASFIKGGDGRDDITLANGASIVNTLVSGNANADIISAGANGRGTLSDSAGSLISGGAGDDIVDVALAGAITVKGGSGKDFLAVGSAQTVSGGLGADTFSIEGKGGATIEDFDAMTQNCFCSDAIQVDGNKLYYTTYDYKATKELYTSASSWAGNIKVKAVAEAVTCNIGDNFTFNATKSHTIDALAVVKWKATAVDTDANLPADLGAPKFPNTGEYFYQSQEFNFQTNGNSPRTTKDVKGNGFGFGSVTGLITKLGITQTTNADAPGYFADGAGTKNFRSVAINNLTVYTTTQFNKGDFSFLNLTKKLADDCDLKQTLVFNKVSQATITNHWASFGTSKKVATDTLYAMKFGTANFNTAMTGKANLVITKLDDKTYVPTAEQYTNSKLTKLTRTKTINAGATITLNLENNFDLFTKRDGFTANAQITNNAVASDNAAVFLQGEGTSGGFFKYEDVSYLQAQKHGLLTHTVATAWDGNVTAANFTPAMNVSQQAGTKARFVGANGGTGDVKTATGNLIAKIAVSAAATVNGSIASLDTWVERAIIPGQTFVLTSNCAFPSNLSSEVIAGNGNNNGKYTPADGGKFGTKYLWVESGGLAINSLINGTKTAENVNSSFDWGNPNMSNGCLTVNGAAGTAFSCSSYARSGNGYNTVVEAYGDAKDVFAGLSVKTNTRSGENFVGNQGAFSGTDFNTKVLAAAGMGDGVFTLTPSSDAKDFSTVKGAPFRILFFDNKGSDNGLYMYSGTANYKSGDVTAINTNPTASSAMGTKQTIVKVTGGKGHEIALSDINLV